MRLARSSRVSVLTAIRSAIKAASSQITSCAPVARTLRQDITILTGPAGSECVANIEPLVINIQQHGGTAVRLPICAHVQEQRVRDGTRGNSRKRICQSCATHEVEGTKSECADCGRVRRPPIAARHGEMLCGKCKPEPEVDHGAKVREGIDALRTGLSTHRDRHHRCHFPGDVGAAGAQLDPARQSDGVHRRETVTNQHDRYVWPNCSSPPALTAYESRSAHSAFAKRRLTSALDDLRCCHRCWSHRRSRGAMCTVRERTTPH